MAKDDKKEGEEGAAPEKKGGGGGLLSIINLALLLIVCGATGFNTWTLFKMSKQAPVAVAATGGTAIPQADDSPDDYAIGVDLDPVTVNLADPNRYLKVKIRLALRSKDDEAKITDRKSEINDLLITLMSGKRYNDISTPLGKYELKEELAHRINKLIGGSPVRKLFFTDFVSQ